MRTACEPRYRKRVPCELMLPDGRHPGMVLNVSRRGLFVQTRARARPGERVRVALNPSHRQDAIGLEARVVWKRVSPPQLQSLTRGGVGLEIQLASDAYYDFLARVATPAVEQSRSPDDRGHAGPGAPGDASLLSRFRVRVSQQGGPRSRALVVRGATEEEARQRALSSMGAGWSILEIERDG